ncbi:MAG: hypothetical protein WC365_03870 [Candidatus Babeliales bacterium]|jgi:hypothetical protein
MKRILLTLGMVAFGLFPIAYAEEPAPSIDAVPTEMPSPEPSFSEDATISDAQAVAVAPAEAAPDAQALTGPEITSLSEQHKGLVTVNDPHIVAIYRDAIGALASMASIIDKPLEQRKKLYEDYFDLDAQLTDFFESSSLGKVMIQETLKADQAKQAAQHADVAEARSKLQAVDPEMVTKKKATLKEILSSCDAEIAKMREIEHAAHKKVMEISQQPTVQAAQAVFQSIQRQAAELTTKAATITEKITKKFQTQQQEIRTLLQTFNKSLKNLQEKWAQAQAADEAALKAAVASAAPAPTPSATKEPEKPAVPPQIDQMAAQETFFNYVTRRMTEITVGAWDVMKTTYQWLFDRVASPAKQTSKKS